MGRIMAGVFVAFLVPMPLQAQAPNAAASPVRVTPRPDAVLDLVGGRSDKNSVGHGKNVALYTGRPSKFFFATHSLNDIFSAVDGQALLWRPDQVIVDGAAHAAGAASPDVIDQRQVCVTGDDVVVSKATLTNTTDKAITYRLMISGDCRQSADWRGGPGGQKRTIDTDNGILLTDLNVFPGFLKDGLSMAIGSILKPTAVDVNTPGCYTLTYDISLTPRETVTYTFACAIDPSASTASANLAKVLAELDPVAENTKSWIDFFTRQVPRFDCSDRSLNELYYFRWFLLKFSTAGGNLGFFKYPVTMEGRAAFQTYCCYSAPFMAFDLNWADGADVGFGQIANMAVAAYPDGRFPWYCSPRTNHVKLDHPSATGQSLLPWAAWRHYQIHGRKDMIAQVYPAMRKDMDWWIRDRDPKHTGLFEIDHQLETGMDDLHRRWTGAKPRRYQAIDATCYAVLNLRAVANMARLLGDATAAGYYDAYADKSAHALNTLCWDSTLQRYRDRNPETGELSDYNSITIFYPLFAGIAGKAQLPMIERYLLNPKEYALPYPVPALSKSDPEFDPAHRYWAGLTWPATNSHVVEGFISTSKRLDRALLPKAAHLFRQIAELQLRPRADFYEHYNPITGQPLSTFRDYMHSWWIDLYVRHVAGLMPQDDGSLVIDPIPLGLTRFSLEGAMIRSHAIDVSYNSPDPGLVVRVDRVEKLRRPDFKPGDAPLAVPQ